jgi:hypothetical protein
MYLLLRFAALLLATGFAFTTPNAIAENRSFSLPNYQANPGAIVNVPLSLDNAAGLAALTIQINFDNTQLELLSVTPGSLGTQFDFSEDRDNSIVQLFFARSENLGPSSGTLAILQFRVKPGLPVDTFTELAIANIALSDSEAVVDLLQIDSLAILNGRITYSASPSIDNQGNGLPDAWETQYGLDPFASPLLDSDQDGLSNLLEYAYGSNPVLADAATRSPRIDAPVQIDDQPYLTLSFVRRTDDPLLQYRLEESTDLTQWTPLNLANQIVGTPQTLDAFSERVQARGSIPMQTGAPRAFLRISIQR